VDKEPEDDDQGDQGCNVKFQDASKTINVIFGGDGDFGSRREQKLLLREIMSVEPAAPRPLRWSEVLISFSRDYQWTSFSKPGKFPLVLDLVVAEVRLTKKGAHRRWEWSQPYLHQHFEKDGSGLHGHAGSK
jgi:hypothetical protein